MHQESFRLDLRKYFFKKGYQALEQLPKEVAESPLLEVFKRHVHVAPGHMD